MSNEIINILSNQTKLRSAVLSMMGDQIDRVIVRLQRIREEKIEAQKDAAAREEIQKKARGEVLSYMADRGLRLDDLSTGKATPTFLYRWKEGKETFEYTGSNLGLISKKAPNGPRFARMLKKTKTLRPKYRANSL